MRHNLLISIVCAIILFLISCTQNETQTKGLYPEKIDHFARSIIHKFANNDIDDIITSSKNEENFEEIIIDYKEIVANLQNKEIIKIYLDNFWGKYVGEEIQYSLEYEIEYSNSWEKAVLTVSKNQKGLFLKNLHIHKIDESLAISKKAGSPKILSGNEINRVLSERFSKNKKVVFHSRDGMLYGMDSDSVISLEKDNRVIVGEYGYTYQGYRGNYSVSDHGVIKITLEGYRGKWPYMKMAANEKIIRLYEVDGDSSIVFGGRSGSFETSDMKPFWPFRLVDTDSSPHVTAIWSGGNILFFRSPTLPKNFKWKEDRIEFRVDFMTLKDGRIQIEKYWPDFDKNDWRHSVAESVIDTMKSWVFNPFRKDGEPTEVGQGWNIDIRKNKDQVRWLIKDDVFTVYDNIPNEHEY